MVSDCRSAGFLLIQDRVDARAELTIRRTSLPAHWAQE
jgi:hypothetical protein